MTKRGLAANLMSQAGADPKAAAAAVAAALQGAPHGRRGPVRARSISARKPRASCESAQEIAEKAGDSFVTAERLLLAMTLAAGTKVAKILADAGLTAQNLNAAIEAVRKGRTADSAKRRRFLRCAQEIRPRPDRGRPGRQIGSR